MKVGRNMILILAALVTAEAPLAATNDVVQSVRVRIDEYVVHDLSQEDKVVGVVENFGLKTWKTARHATLEACISNNVDIVFANFEECATNQLNRYVLLSAGWSGDEEYRLLYLDKLLDKVMDGTLSKGEFNWFRIGHRSPALFEFLLRRHGETAVSNLVNKLELATGETNYCSRIRSGEAWAEYQEFMRETSASKR